MTGRRPRGSCRKRPVLSCRRAACRPVSIVHEQQAPQERLVIPVFHDLLQFVLESQGGLGRNLDGPGQIERGDAVLGLGDQVDGQHPDGQGPLSRGKDGALGRRGRPGSGSD